MLSTHSNDIMEIFDKAEEPQLCRCKSIVMNAYQNLREDGLSHCQAVKRVVPVLQYHHPSPFVEAQNVVECWVFKKFQTTSH